LVKPALKHKSPFDLRQSPPDTGHIVRLCQRNRALEHRNSLVLLNDVRLIVCDAIDVSGLETRATCAVERRRPRRGPRQALHRPVSLGALHRRGGTEQRHGVRPAPRVQRRAEQNASGG
jgi:hypothetical protein